MLIVADTSSSTIREIINRLNRNARKDGAWFIELKDHVEHQIKVYMLAPHGDASVEDWLELTHEDPNYDWDLVDLFADAEVDVDEEIAAFSVHYLVQTQGETK